MKKSIVIIPVIFFLLSCSTTMTITEIPVAPFIQLDSTCNYYIREVYKVDSGRMTMLKSGDMSAFGDKKKLIEIEYLFISNDKKRNVVYMTTVPDRRQMRYSENYLGKEYVNMHDVRVIYFGKIKNPDRNNFIFKKYSDGDEDEWSVVYTDEKGKIAINTVSVTRNGEFVDMMPVEKALADPVKFDRVSSFQLVYYNPKPVIKDTTHVKENRIYYEKGNKMPVYLWYDKQLDDGYKVKHYKKKKIPYNPDEIFSKQ